MLKIYAYENNCGDKGIIIAESMEKRFFMRNILTGKSSELLLTPVKFKVHTCLKPEL